MSKPIQNDYVARRAAELLACGLSVEEASGIMRLPENVVSNLKPKRLTPLRKGDLITDSRRVRGGRPNASESPLRSVSGSLFSLSL